MHRPTRAAKADAAAVVTAETVESTSARLLTRVNRDDFGARRCERTNVLALSMAVITSGTIPTIWRKPWNKIRLDRDAGFFLLAARI